MNWKIYFKSICPHFCRFYVWFVGFALSLIVRCRRQQPLHSISKPSHLLLTHTHVRLRPYTHTHTHTQVRKGQVQVQCKATAEKLFALAVSKLFPVCEKYVSACVYLLTSCMRLCFVCTYIYTYVRMKMLNADCLIFYEFQMPSVAHLCNVGKCECNFMHRFVCVWVCI